MKQVHQDEMTEARVVAVWIGNHRDELELDDYINNRFEAEFGFIMNDRMMPEVDVHPQPILVADLLKGFSMSEHWHESAVTRCNELQIHRSASAVVFHFLRFDSARCVTASNTELQFIGNFDWPAKKTEQGAAANP